VRTCQAWGLTCGASAELVVSELVANAVLHGWGHVLLRLDDTEDGLRIEVEDANPAPPVTTDGHRGRVGGFGMQIVERLADWGWRPAGTGKVVWAKIRVGEDTDD
jgi:two-component sensor histidine kinase